jgi:transposase-like protein
MTKPIARDAIYRKRVFDAEVLELCVRWYITYRLFYRDLIEIMAERGIQVAHTTILRWVIRYVPEYEKRWNRLARPVGTSWRVDETYVSVRGRWHYLYRAVDKHGKTIDFLLRRDRGIAAAQAFFRKALSSVAPRVPRKITLDGHVPSRRALVASTREPLLAQRQGSNEPIPQQHSRAGSPCHQTTMQFDGGIQVFRERGSHDCRRRARASNSKEAVQSGLDVSPSPRMVPEGRMGNRTRVERNAEPGITLRMSAIRGCTRTLSFGFARARLPCMPANSCVIY